MNFNKLIRRTTFVTLNSLFQYSTSKRYIPPINPLIQILSFPGARAVELSKPQIGNIITENALQFMKKKIELYSKNPTVGAIFFTSSKPHMFSDGMEPKLLSDTASRNKLSNQVNDLSSLISKLENAIPISVYSGIVDSCAYEVFASSHFRLGTSSTKFQIASLLRGHLPLSDKLLSQISEYSTNGFAISRYLGISGRVLTAHDMYVLGLLTHVVEEEPHLTLIDALTHTVPRDDYYKATQSSMIDTETIEELLDSMNVYMSSDFLHDPDVLSHPIWDKVMLVPPQPIPLESFFQDEETKSREEDLAADVVNCFSSDSIRECKDKVTDISNLGGSSSDWAVATLDHWDRIQPELIDAWFEQTKQSSSVSSSRRITI